MRCVALLAFALVLHGQSSADLLRRAANFYNNLDSFHVVGYAKARLPGTSWQVTYDVETEAAQPKFIPLGLRRASMQAVSTVKNFRQTRVIADTSDPFPSRSFLMPPFGGFENLTQRLLETQRIGLETISYQGHEYRCEVIDAVYDESPEFKPNTKSSHRKIYIDPNSLWVLKEVRPDPNVGEWTFLATSITINEQPSEALIEALQRSAEQIKPKPEWQGRTAPDLMLDDLSGNRVRLADLHGHPILLDFWASYCGPCRRVAAISEELSVRYRGSGLVVWGVTQDTLDDTRLWLRFNHLSLPTLLDGNGAAFKAFEVEGVPVTVLIDEQGRVAKYWEGSEDQKQIEQSIQQIVGRSH